MSDHFNNENQRSCGSSLHARKNIFALSVRCTCVFGRLPLCLFARARVCMCVSGGWLLWWWCCGCRAPNEGVRNKISAPGSSSAPRLPQTPSDWKWNSCDDLIYMLITNGPPENRPINAFLLPPVSPRTQGNERERDWVGGGGGGGGVWVCVCGG